MLRAQENECAGIQGPRQSLATQLWKETDTDKEQCACLPDMPPKEYCSLVTGYPTVGVAEIRGGNMTRLKGEFKGKAVL
jgi:hypothetical protein